MSHEKNSIEGLQVPEKIKTASDVEIVSLRIEEDLDAGGDPYNRTGSFVVIKTPEDD
jgi:hypothetical protein